MAQLYEWHLTAAEVAQLDALKFTAHSQAPTYFSSGGCPESFGVILARKDVPPTFACKNAHDLKSSWC